MSPLDLMTFNTQSIWFHIKAKFGYESLQKNVFKVTLNGNNSYVSLILRTIKISFIHFYSWSLITRSEERHLQNFTQKYQFVYKQIQLLSSAPLCSDLFSLC